MDDVLVFLQHDNGGLPKSARGLITAARALQRSWKKRRLVGLCLGVAAHSAARAALEYGLDTVLYSTQPVLERFVAAIYAAAVLQAGEAEGCDVVVGSATSLGKELFPRVAVGLNAGQASEIVGVNDDGTLRRVMHAGEVLAEIEVRSSNRVVTVRSTAFAPADKEAARGTAREMQFQVADDGAVEVVSGSRGEGGRPDLLTASRVVSGGRALNSAESFRRYILPLADALGAAVGASRAAVDAGCAPNDWQVGQTGKVVAPDLYVAVGISGAVQHLAGIKDAKVIVAINRDEKAPIFDVADYGLVADLRDAVPALVEEIEKIRRGAPSS